MQTELGVFLRKFRADNNVTQTKLEQELKAKSGYISKLESGAIQRPEDRVLTKLAAVTGRRLEELRAMCRPVATVGAKLKMACGHSLWNAPLYCAAGKGLLPGIQVGSFYKSKALGPLQSDKIRVADLDWIETFSDQPDEVVERPSLVPLSAADVASLLERDEVEIGALPGNLVRDGQLREQCICVGTIVDTASGCSFVYSPNYHSPFPKDSLPDSPLSTHELGNYLVRLKKPKRVRIGAEEGTIAAEYLDQACYSHGLQRHEVLWNCRAADLKTQSFQELAAQCKRAENADLLGVVAWEPHATWLDKMTFGKDGLRLCKAPLHLAPRTVLNGEMSSATKPRHLTYEIVIPKLRLAAPSPLRRDLFQSLSHLMNAAAGQAAILNNTEKASDAVMRRLAEFYGFLDPGTKTADDDQAIRETKLAIGGVLYSVRWNVVPEMGIGPQA